MMLPATNEPKRSRSLVAYLFSLPERTVRALVAGLGGALYQVTLVILPGWLRRSRLYQATVERLLRIVVELVGAVGGTFPPEEMSIGELALRKAAGNAVELVTFAAVGWSPVWLLAAAADVLGGSQVYLRALVADLQSDGVLSTDAQIASVQELLVALEQTLGQAADTVDMPPLNVEDMRASWTALRDKAALLPDANGLAQLYKNLQAAARREGTSIYVTSSLIARGAVRTGLAMGNEHVFAYYRRALDDIAEEGLPAFVSRVSRPYGRAILRHFDPQVPSHTERLIRRSRSKGVRTKRSSRRRERRGK
jgi:hypothetical protein